jgi:hypothetical protein
MPEESGRILRPLLHLTRTDVLAYLSALGVSYSEDSTNSDPRYLRNRIRGRLIPVLNAEFPGWSTAVRRAADTQKEIARFIVGEAEKRVAWSASARYSGAVETDKSGFFSADPVVRVESLYLAADAVIRENRKSGFDISADAETRKERNPARRAVVRFAAGAQKAQNLGAARAFVRGGAVVVEPVRSGTRTSGFSILVAGEGAFRCAAGNFLISGTPRQPSIPVSLPLVVRSPRFNEPSKLRSLIPPRERDCALAFVIEDSDGVAGIAVAGTGETLKPIPAERKARATDYAETKFFSIL